MKKILSLLLAAMMVLALCACGGNEAAAPAEAPAAEAPAAEAPAAEAPAAAEVTWADYQEYLIEKAGGNSPDPAAFADEVHALTGWDDIDDTIPPWNLMFTTIGLSTWEEFQNGVVKEPLVTGGPDMSASGEPSGEPTEEPAN